MSDTPNAQIEMLALSALTRHERNSRKHPEEQIEQIKESIQQFGWTMPILVDEDHTILAGHARHEAAQRLGLKEAPCIVTEGWPEEKKRAYIIADNRLTEIGQWDFEMLKQELDFLSDVDFSLNILGFDDAFLEAMSINPMKPSNQAGSGVSEANDPYAEWKGMPEFNQEPDLPYHTMKVHFLTAEDLDKFSELMGRDFSGRPAFTWYPAKDKVVTTHVGFMDESDAEDEIDFETLAPVEEQDG